MKECRKCHTTKPLTDFHRHTNYPDGYRNICKICRQIKPTQKSNRLCANCNTPFYAIPSLLRKGKTYCSRRCAVAQRKPRTTHIPNTVCLTCKTPFHKNLHTLNKGHGKYCSQHCYGMSLLKLKPTFTCLSCGVLFQSPHRRYETKRGRKFCSGKCWGTFAKNVIHQTPDKRLARLRAAPSEKITLQEIYLRDGRTCQICGKKTLVPGKGNGRAPKAPTLDHIIPVSHKDFMSIGHVRINVRLAHYRCNNHRRNRGDNAQYLLFG
jgi:HNH endonuclease